MRVDLVFAVQIAQETRYITAMRECFYAWWEPDPCLVCGEAIEDSSFVWVTSLDVDEQCLHTACAVRLATHLLCEAIRDPYREDVTALTVTHPAPLATLLWQQDEAEQTQETLNQLFAEFDRHAEDDDDTDDDDE